MIQYKGGNGSSKGKAVIILGVESELEGVDAEYDYLQRKFGDFELNNQTFIGEEDKKYDLLSIKLSDGTKKEIWFDISDFYGRE